MQPINKTAVNRALKFIDEMSSSHKKPAHEIKLNDIARILNGLGCEGPINRPGSDRAFRHEAFLNHPAYTSGQFGVHVVHGRETVRYADYKKYILPHIHEIISYLEEHHLIQEDNHVPF